MEKQHTYLLELHRLVISNKHPDHFWVHVIVIHCPVLGQSDRTAQQMLTTRQVVDVGGCVRYSLFLLTRYTRVDFWIYQVTCVCASFTALFCIDQDIGTSSAPSRHKEPQYLPQNQPLDSVYMHYLYRSMKHLRLR